MLKILFRNENVIDQYDFDIIPYVQRLPLSFLQNKLAHVLIHPHVQAGRTNSHTRLSFHQMIWVIGLIADQSSLGSEPQIFAVNFLNISGRKGVPFVPIT